MVHNTIALLPIGVMMGVIASMPIGPINVAVLATALRRDVHRGVAMVCAVALVDGLYAFAFLSALNFFQPPSKLATMVEPIGAVIIIAYGIFLVLNRNHLSAAPSQRLVSAAPREWRLGILTGVVLSIANPAVMVFWLTVAGMLHTWMSSVSSAASRVIFSGGVICGTAAWFGTLLYGVQSTSARISQAALRRLCLLLGILLIGCGAHFLMRRWGGIG